MTNENNLYFMQIRNKFFSAKKYLHKTNENINFAATILERWQSGRLRRSRKPLFAVKRTGGSNPPFSAKH